MQPNSHAQLGSPDATLGRVTSGLTVLLVGLGIVGVGAACYFGWRQGDGWRHFLHAYLTTYCFLLSLSLGGLFFVALQHATRAGWSVSVRRVAEVVGANQPCLALLFLPILVPVLLGSSALYSWNDSQIVAASEVLRHKAAYLDAEFFAVRAVFYFAVWGWLGRYFLSRSVAQDVSGDPELTRKMERMSAPALLLLALTLTFASFDWLMSLEPAWFSTIFGVYFFSGAAVGFLAAVILLLLFLQAAGRLSASVTIEHYHDLGKMLFGFVVFWGYIAFSQYLLIWYANIPEETTWYLPRQTGVWRSVSLVLLLANLLIPFFGLLSRAAKRNRLVLGFWAVWLLAAHWIDMYYLVMPSLGLARLPLGPIEIGLLVGMGSLYLAGLLLTAGQRSLVPLADPRLEEALTFENF